MLRKSQKLLFGTKIVQKLLQKKNKKKNCCSLSLFGMTQKYNKSKISKHFCAILRRNFVLKYNQKMYE